MGTTKPRPDGFDGAAAVTRSLLGYGLLAGAIYLIVGLSLALTREGFDLTQHPLSLLMLGDGGWMQRTNLIVAGVMTLAASIGFARALRGPQTSTGAATLVAVYGASLVLSGAFAPDPMAGFPPGTAPAEGGSVAGILHLGSGAVGFIALAAAALLFAGWFRSRNRTQAAAASRGAAVVVLAGFLGGAALATRPVGVALLWLAVVTGWVWLAAASVQLYRAVPHPDVHRRAPSPDEPGTVEHG